MTVAEHITEHDAEKRLVRALRGRQGRITRADAEALTGLPSSIVEQTLSSMLATYRSHLAATESGELLYAFDPAMIRRTAEPLRVRFQRIAEWLWRAFVFLFKIAIVTTLVVYFIIFLLLILGLFMARVSGRRGDYDRDDDHRGGSVFPIELLWWMLPWDFHRRTYQPLPYRYSTPKPKKKVYQQVFDFVFGPIRKKPDPGASDRETLAYIRAHQGRIVAAELVALKGLDLSQAEEEATRLMCNYNGDPEVTEEGVVVYVFREIRRSAAPTSKSSGKWNFIWDKLEQKSILTGNRPWANVVIGCMNAFNMIMPIWFIPDILLTLGLNNTSAEIWLKWVPFYFSTTFFAVPLARVLVRAAKEPRRHLRNVRRLILQEIYTTGGTTATLIPEKDRRYDPGVIIKSIHERYPAKDETIKAELDKMIVSLNGDVVLEASTIEDIGKITFPVLQEEFATVQNVRRAAPPEETEVGAIVFDSAQELETGDKGEKEN